MPRTTANTVSETCQSVEVQADAIPRERISIMARPVLAAVRAAFERPEIQAEYAEWLAARKVRK